MAKKARKPKTKPDPVSSAAKLLCAMKGNLAYQEIWDNPPPVGRASMPFWSRVRREVTPGVRLISNSPYGFKDKDGKRLLTDDEADAILNPRKSDKDVPEPKRSFVLPRLFQRSSVMQVPPVVAGLEDDAVLSGVRELTIRADFPDGYNHAKVNRAKYEYRATLESNKRLLVVDLRETRGQLIENFEAFLDAVGKTPRTDKRTREQDERHLKVWDMVTRRGMSTKEIAVDRGISQDTVKRSIRRGYQITQGTDYPPGMVRAIRRIDPALLVNLCPACPKRETCTTPCDEVNRIADQDKKGLLGKTSSKLSHASDGADAEVQNQPFASMSPRLPSDYNDATEPDPCGNPAKRKEAPLKLSPEEIRKRKEWLKKTSHPE